MVDYLAIRKQKSILRRETAAWQKAALWLLVLSVAWNTAQTARIDRLDAVRRDTEAQLHAAEYTRDLALTKLGELSRQAEADKQARAEQAAAEDEAKKLNLNPTVTANIIENCTITYYCAEEYPHICGFGLGITATGAECNPGHIVAVDPNVIPLHSKVIVDYGDGDLHCYSAEDVGGSVKGSHIDIMCETHEEALNLGKTAATVYWIEQENLP